MLQGVDELRRTLGLPIDPRRRSCRITRTRGRKAILVSVGLARIEMHAALRRDRLDPLERAFAFRRSSHEGFLDPVRVPLGVGAIQRREDDPGKNGEIPAAMARTGGATPRHRAAVG